MTRRVKSLFAASALLVLALFATSPALAWQETWKFATLAPDGVGWARQIKAIVIPAMKEVTNDNLTVKVYWGGIMGDDEDYIKKMRIDQLQGAGLSGQGVVLAIPEMAVVELPFLFSNYDEVDYIKSKMSDTFDAIAKKNGYFMVAWIDQDFDRLYSVDQPVKRLADFRKLKILSWFGEIEGYTLERLDATPVMVNMPEAPASLRQGIGNAIISASAWMVGTQLYSVARYVSPLDMRYAPALIAVSWDRWENFPPEYQKEYYKRRAKVIEDFCREVRNDNATCYKAMIQYGLREVPVKGKNLDAIRERVRPLWDDLAGELYPKPLLDEVLGYLEEYRKKECK